MTRITRKRIVIGAVLAVVAGLLVLAFLPKPVPVRTSAVRRGPLAVTVEEEGRTEVADRYEITAPVAAYLRRITLEEGEAVRKGQPLVRLEPPRSPILDPRAHTEAAERVKAAQATAGNAAEQRERVARLAADGAATRQALEQATSEAQRAAAELAAAEAALRRTDATLSLGVQRVLTAPAAGRVLSVERRSEGQVNPGDALLVIGDARNLEVHVDVLSEDAVRMRPGTRAKVEQWGGERPLDAVVERIDPQGFTKVSSLGVEEQRVKVVATISSPPDAVGPPGIGLPRAGALHPLAGAVRPAGAGECPLPRGRRLGGLHRHRRPRAAAHGGRRPAGRPQHPGPIGAHRRRRGDPASR